MVLASSGDGVLTRTSTVSGCLEGESGSGCGLSATRRCSRTPNRYAVRMIPWGGA